MSSLNKKSELMTIEETSVFLNLKISRLRSLVFKSEIPFIKIGRLVRFRAQDLHEWLLDQQRGPSRSVRAPYVRNDRSLFEMDTHFSKTNFERN